MLIYFPWEVSDYRDCFFVYLRSRPGSAAPLTVWTLRQGSDGATCCLSTSRGGCWVHAVSLDHKQQHGALPPPPLPDRLWYWFDGVGYCSSIVKLDVTVSAAAGSNDSEWWARALGRGGISGWFISGDRHLNVLLMTSCSASSSEQDAGGRRNTLDKGDCINVVLLACCHNGPGPIH